jgi:hypothetical protein
VAPEVGQVIRGCRATAFVRSFRRGVAMTKVVPPSVGEVAPDFSLPDATGAPRRLADLCAERPLVLVFYRGHW